MIKATVYSSNGEFRVLEGIVGSRAGENAIQFIRYSGGSVLIPFTNVDAIEIENLSDEQILESKDAGFVAWFKDYLERQKEAAVAEVEELKEAGVALQ